MKEQSGFNPIIPMPEDYMQEYFRTVQPCIQRLLLAIIVLLSIIIILLTIKIIIDIKTYKNNKK